MENLTINMKAKILILMSLFLCMFIPIFAQEEVVLIEDASLLNVTENESLEIDDEEANLINESVTEEEEEKTDKFFMNFTLLQLIIVLVIALIILTLVWKLIKFAFKIGLIIFIIILVIWIIQKIL
jgi:cytoskeletal protein RodZ